MTSVLINFNSYTLDRKIGQGGFGEVYVARDDKNSNECVIKIVKTSKTQIINQTINEIKTLEWLTRKLKDLSPFNKLIDYEIVYDDMTPIIYIVMDYIDGLNLYAV